MIQILNSTLSYPSHSPVAAFPIRPLISSGFIIDFFSPVVAQSNGTVENRFPGCTVLTVNNKITQTFKLYSLIASDTS